MNERVPPHSKETEKALLGCLIVEPDLINELEEGFSGNDFYDKNYAIIFNAIKGLYDSGSGIDETTLSEKLKSLKAFDDVGGLDTIIDLVRDAPLSHNVREYSGIIREHARTRGLIKLSERAIESAYSGSSSVLDIIKGTEAELFKLSQEGDGERDLCFVEDIVNATLENMKTVSDNPGQLTGVATGFSELDKRTSGLQKSDLIILAARPSMGKTALALNIAVNAAVREKKQVVIFSLEMSKEQLVQRMILSEALIEGDRVRSGMLDQERDWVPITYAAEAIASANILINDKPGLSLTQMRSILRRAGMQGKVDLIVVDYLQLMSSDKHSDNRQTEVSEISRGLKSIAREMKCPLLCLSQLARGPETRTDKRPMLSDLRDSGSIEQDADVVMFLYRDAYYNKESELDYEAELNIAKQRNGPTGKISLCWLPEYTKFTEMLNSYEEY